MTPNYSTWRTRAIPIAGNFTGIITGSQSALDEMAADKL
jgi:hypothetical protein